MFIKPQGFFYGQELALSEKSHKFLYRFSFVHYYCLKLLFVLSNLKCENNTAFSFYD